MSSEIKPFPNIRQHRSEIECRKILSCTQFALTTCQRQQTQEKFEMEKVENRTELQRRNAKTLKIIHGESKVLEPP